MSRTLTAAKSYRTLSGLPLDPVYTADQLAGLDLNEPGQFPYTRGIHETMYRGKLWTMRQFAGFATAEETNARYRYLLSQGQSGLSVAFDLPTLMGFDSDHPTSLGEVGKCGVAISSLADMETLVPGDSAQRRYRLDDHQLARVHHLGHVSGGRRAAGRLLGSHFGNLAERHPEGIHRAKGIYLSSAAFHAAGHRFHRVRSPARAALQPDFDLRLSHSGGRIDGSAGTRVYSARWNRIRRLGHRTRTSSRFICAPPEFLLQRAQRFLRGDRQVSRGAEDLGVCDARSLRGSRRTQLEAAFPCADRRMFAHLAAAPEQHCADRHSGSGRGSRRMPVAAHQFAR